MNKNIKIITILLVTMFSSAVLLLPNIGSDNDIVNFIGQYKNDEPDKSGPVERLPWEEDENFIEAQLKNNTPVLMAAYHAVLNDPLPGEEYNVHLGARLVAGTVVKSGEVFSQNLTIGPYTTHRGYKKGPTYSGTKLTTTIGGGVCKIASTLYNTVVLSNLQVVERHSHSMPVPYVPYGQDATVSYGVYDFKFKNNTKDPIMIWAQGVDNILFMAIYGVSKPPRIEWNHQILSTRKSPVIYKKNNELPVGTKKVVMDGMDGAVIKSSIIIYKTDGTKEVKNMGNSSYRPLPTIVETGT